MRLNEIRRPRLQSHMLRRGTILYHGTSNHFDEANESLWEPAWFSDNPEATHWYVDWHEIENPKRRVIQYSLRVNKRLLLIKDRAAMRDLEDYYGVDINGTEQMAEDVCKMGLDGWYVPNNHKGPDIMLCRTGDLSYVRTLEPPPSRK